MYCRITVFSPTYGPRLAIYQNDTVDTRDITTGKEHGEMDLYNEGKRTRKMRMRKKVAFDAGGFFQERKLPDLGRRRASLSADGSHGWLADVH